MKVKLLSHPKALIWLIAWSKAKGGVASTNPATQ